ncbi:hypothetical protein [Malacoplasma muris]|uniref:hypothetical protein n=1 Tax=Malacoplasma muris TaxID=2119 RepID=UPI00398EC322
MSELDKLKHVHFCEKFSGIWSIIYVFCSLYLLPVYIALTSWYFDSSYKLSTHDAEYYRKVATILVGIYIAYTVLTFMLCLFFNIKSIFYSIELVSSKNKWIYITMSILSIFLLGVICNIVNWILVNKEIKSFQNDNISGQIYEKEIGFPESLK